MNYDCITFKPFYKNNHDAEAHRLQELEEARGQLLRVFEAEGQTVAAFSWGAISLPGELREELEPLVGHEIGALRLDGKIHVRRLDS
ncbi:MAG: hypothetical protein A4E44_00144 [Methanosaeta sp. PtaB.Bin018]|nr:MAG: hypothetical protein A4E44_00144 [Methanosaeta sp. PtaB.Bin018]OPY48124.1 MAG: hypothetical protein A4E46_00099 [Methanosaeta sp. PtaU1.Bin016]